MTDTSPLLPNHVSLLDEVPARILVVDDSEPNREVLARRLRQQGYTTEMAVNGSEAIEKIRTLQFDLVLLDIMMPGIDGYEVLRRVKADARLRHIPVIVISAMGEIENAVRCIEMGAEDYLPKPFNPTLLKARVTTCVEKKLAHDREAKLFRQLQENYARLHAIERQRDDLTNMIIHDLRSPLSANLASLEMLGMLDSLSPEQRDCLAIARRSGQHLLEMINDLLDISKLEAGALGLERSPFDTRHAVAMAVDQIRPLLQDKELNLQFDLAPDLSPVDADENKLRRVLVNLLGNAVKFTPRGGQITVSAQAGKANVLFAVQDTGEGIAPEATQYIFEKFAQVAGRKAGRSNSTGLGLAFCKLVVEAHNGRIWVESTLGKGSTFFFTIPTALRPSPEMAS